MDIAGGPTIAPALRGLAVPIDTVELHPRNPRQGDVAAVAASLRRFGQLKPLVVQASTRYVVAGNHLLKAARSLGWSEVAANVEAMDDATATAFLLTDHRTYDLGTYELSEAHGGRTRCRGCRPGRRHRGTQVRRGP